MFSKMSDAIGILVPEFPQQTHIFFWREIVALRELDVDVAILSTRRPPADACRHEFAERARNETHYLYPPRAAAAAERLARRPRRVLQALSYVAMLRESSAKQKSRAAGLLICAADLAEYAETRGIRHVHSHSCADAAHIVAMAYLLGGPSYSLTLHGDLPVYGTDHGSKTRYAVCMGCDGPHLKTQLIEEVGYPADRVLPNWMGLDTSRFVGTGARAMEPGRLHMLTVARLNRSKGHVHALRAMKAAIERGSDIRYTLAGEGPYRAEIEAEIERLRLRDRVVLLGTQSEAQVLEQLRAHDAFVLPSIGLGEAGPISLMEAMSAGLPAVVSIIGSTPHMVEHGVSGLLVEQGDEAGLCEAFVSLCQDVELRRRIGQAARSRAVEEFDGRHTAMRLLEFIEKNGSFRFARARKTRTSRQEKACISAGRSETR